jgi:hypothetical protein
LFAPPAPAARLPVWRVRWIHCLAVTLAVAVTAAINYAVFIEPNLDRNIAGGGPDAGLDAWSARLVAKSVTLIRLFKHFFFSFGEPWSGVWLDLLMVGAALVALLGLGHLLARGGKGRPCNLDRAAVLAFPIAGAFVLDIAGYYPLISPRLNIFLLPAVLVLFGIGVQALVVRGRLLFGRSRPVRASLRSPRPYAAIGIGLAALFILRIAVVGPAPFFTWAAATDEDTEAAVSYLAEVAGPGDVLYVDTSMLEPLRWYARFAPIDVARVVQGTIAWPCCPRDKILDRQASPERVLPPEIDRIFAGGVGDTLWMLYTGRPYHRKFIGVNYPDRFDAFLRERGCRNVDNPHFEGVRLDGYQCPPDVGRHRSIGQLEGAPASGRPQQNPGFGDMIRSYRVWDAPTRWCHWINSLVGYGFAINLLALTIAGTPLDVAEADRGS